MICLCTCWLEVTGDEAITAHKGFRVVGYYDHYLLKTKFGIDAQRFAYVFQSRFNLRENPRIVFENLHDSYLNVEYSLLVWLSYLGTIFKYYFILAV